MKIKFNVLNDIKIPFISVNVNERNNDTERIFNDINIINKSYEIILHENKRIIKKYLYQINRFYTENKKVKCETNGGIYDINKRIYQLVAELPNNLFVQISSSEIISIIKNIELTKNGTYKIRLTNNNLTFTSRRYVNKLRSSLLWKNFLN